MTGRLPVEPAPGPLEEYATRFVVLFRRARAVCRSIDRYRTISSELSGDPEQSLAPMTPS